MSESELEYRSGALKLEHGLHNIGQLEQFQPRVHPAILSNILHGNLLRIALLNTKRAEENSRAQQKVSRIVSLHVKKLNIFDFKCRWSKIVQNI